MHRQWTTSSPLAGNSNRNGYQQIKTGRLGGPGYDGGHASPSALGFIGEKAGLFPTTNGKTAARASRTIRN
ncbi:hypothetical protein ACIPWF_19020 [Paenarthrobacter sp. NPDC089989]|uniref:hypothetical protein n=1 Tax=unclassified Paenarthrobacter TaxID=2634190 RepID=UPI0038104278